MRTFRMGAIGSIAILLLSGSVAFAEGNAASTENRGKFDDYRKEFASTTERMKEVRNEALTRIENQKDKIENRINDIKDKVKQEIAKNLAKQFDNINSTWTDKFMNQLDRYDSVLVKIASSTSSTASTTLAIQSAKTAILNARTAVVAQAAKIYALDPSIIPATATSTPSGQEKIMKSIRASFQNLHKALFKELFALRDGLMKDARNAVQKAIKTLKQNDN